MAGKAKEDESDEATIQRREKQVGGLSKWLTSSSIELTLNLFKISPLFKTLVLIIINNH